MVKKIYLREEILLLPLLPFQPWIPWLEKINLREEFLLVNPFQPWIPWPGQISICNSFQVKIQFWAFAEKTGELI